MSELTLEEVQALYLETFGKEPYNAIKNSIEKMQDAIGKEKVKTKPTEIDDTDQPQNDTNAPSIDDIKEDKNEELKEETSKLSDIRQIQQFYGIVTAELYDDEALKKYKLTKKELKIVKEWRGEDIDDRKISFDLHQAPDYIIPIIRHYGITLDDMKDNDDLEDKIMEGCTKDKKDIAKREKQIHQIKEFYNNLVKESIKNVNSIKDTYI